MIKEMRRKFAKISLNPTVKLQCNIFRSSFWADLRDDTRGVLAIYVVLMLTLFLGTGILAVDFGRMAVLRTQMQNAADAAATAAAARLNGIPGARNNATAAANAFTANSSLPTGSGDLAIQNLSFFSSYDADTGTGVAATEDADAVIAQVTIAPQIIDLILAPLIDLLNPPTGKAPTNAQLTAVSTARFAPIVCNATPFMVCDPAEGGDTSLSLASTSNIGKQLLIKQAGGGGSLAPGQFGLLCTAGGDCGASDIGDALASELDGACVATEEGDVETAPGAKTNQIRDGVNARFDIITGQAPAQNVVIYPKDTSIADGSSVFMGNGVFDASAYWSSNHSGDALPADLSSASRYQIYLYELGETYARNGLQTRYPIPSDLPAGFTTITPPSADIPASGVPSSTPSTNIKRRVVQVAVLRCVAQDVKGSGTFSTNGRYVETFVTEGMPNVSDDLFGEIIHPIDESNSANFHANVFLLD